MKWLFEEVSVAMPRWWWGIVIVLFIQAIVKLVVLVVGWAA
jgi:hypothetical protein